MKESVRFRRFLLILFHQIKLSHSLHQRGDVSLKYKSKVLCQTCSLLPPVIGKKVLKPSSLWSNMAAEASDYCCLHPQVVYHINYRWFQDFFSSDFHWGLSSKRTTSAHFAIIIIWSLSSGGQLHFPWSSWLWLLSPLERGGAEASWLPKSTDSCYLDSSKHAPWQIPVRSMKEHNRESCS